MEKNYLISIRNEENVEYIGNRVTLIDIIKVKITT